MEEFELESLNSTRKDLTLVDEDDRKKPVLGLERMVKNEEN